MIIIKKNYSQLQRIVNEKECFIPQNKWEISQIDYFFNLNLIKNFNPLSPDCPLGSRLCSSNCFVSSHVHIKHSKIEIFHVYCIKFASII